MDIKFVVPDFWIIIEIWLLNPFTLAIQLSVFFILSLFFFFFFFLFIDLALVSNIEPVRYFSI